MQSRDLLRNRRDEVIDWFRGLSNSFGFLVSVVFNCFGLELNGLQVGDSVWSAKGNTIEWDVGKGLHQILQFLAERPWSQVGFWFLISLFQFWCPFFRFSGYWLFDWIVWGGGAGTNWMLENWQFSLGVLGSFPLYKRVCPCKFQFPFYQCSSIPYRFSMYTFWGCILHSTCLIKC